MQVSLCLQAPAECRPQQPQVGSLYGKIEIELLLHGAVESHPVLSRVQQQVIDAEPASGPPRLAGAVEVAIAQGSGELLEIDGYDRTLPGHFAMQGGFAGNRTRVVGPLLLRLNIAGGDLQVPCRLLLPADLSTGVQLAV